MSASLTWKFWVGLAVLLVFLPFILGFLSSLTINWARKAAERHRPCPRCKSERNLMFYEGIRPGAKMNELKSLLFDLRHRLYRCRNCGAKLIVDLRGNWRDATPDEWDNATKTRAMYERVDAMRRGFGVSGPGDPEDADPEVDPDDDPGEADA